MDNTVDHEHTANLLETFALLCRKCRSGDVQVEVGGNHYTEEIYIKCNGCGETACIYSIYTGDLDE